MMHFPIERFDSLDYDARARAILSWYQMKINRDAAIYARKWKCTNDARRAYNSAILAIRDVKYWAEKAKEIRK